MGIRILPKSEIKKTSTDFNTPILLFANPKNIYQRRTARLEALAKNSPLGDYLRFAAKISTAQLEILTQQPLPQQAQLEEISCSCTALANNPFYGIHWKRSEDWLKILMLLLEKIKPDANELTLATIEWLEKAHSDQINQLADYLLAQQYEKVSSDKAVFIWAALSLYWLQLVQQIPHNAELKNTENLHCCPICNAPPVASVIQLGATQGLRYLHCSLCETEWNVVRAKCSQCDQTNNLEYWVLDNEFSAVRTETCEDCYTYLKVMYQEKDPYLEPIADDLSSIFLDIEMESKGFSRSGLNPFMFPNNEIS